MSDGRRGLAQTVHLQNHIRETKEMKTGAEKNGVEVSAREKPFGEPSKYALLNRFAGKSISDIFQANLRVSGGVEVVSWMRIHNDLGPILKRLGMDPKATRYQVDFIRPDNPLAVGYYQLVGIRPLPCSQKKPDKKSAGFIFEERKIGETTLSDFILGYAMVQWRSIGLKLEKASIKPNSGEHEPAFHIKKEGDVLIIAASWIDLPSSEEKIAAS